MQKVRLTPLGKVVVLIFIITIISGFKLIESGMSRSNSVLAGERSSFEVPNIESIKENINAYGLYSADASSLKNVVLSINFSPDSAEIKDDYYQALNIFSEIAKTLADTKIQVEGNTAVDSKFEDLEIANNLSLMRARIVANYLEHLGIHPERIIIVANGSNKPLGDNNTVDGRKLNRRTDVFFKTY